LGVPDLDNRLVDRLAAARETKAIVLLFTSVECPISNRLAPTTHDLEDALTATLAGNPVAHPITQAIGCFLSDVLR
jgi:hypothetical protein